MSLKPRLWRDGAKIGEIKPPIEEIMAERVDYETRDNPLFNDDVPTISVAVALANDIERQQRNRVTEEVINTCLVCGSKGYRRACPGHKGRPKKEDKDVQVQPE